MPILSTLTEEEERRSGGEEIRGGEERRGTQERGVCEKFAKANKMRMGIYLKTARDSENTAGLSH